MAETPSYTIAKAQSVARMLKNAFRAVRAAMYESKGAGHIDDVRTQLDTLTSTNADTIAKAIVDIVKNDTGQ
jgi:hypothetical protein